MYVFIQIYGYADTKHFPNAVSLHAMYELHLKYSTIYVYIYIYTHTQIHIHTYIHTHNNLVYVLLKKIPT